ncbi:prolyl oligopeptidase family serine peptidase [Brevundimonas sp.]|uniref:S9 family peptidase n=1 Tax=Brevundimonas sp. TaxID=1871086 RepID=UPI0035AE8519
MRAAARLALVFAFGLVSPTVAEPAQADDTRPWTIEAMLERESISRSSFSPTGAHVVIERERGWATAEVYDPGPTTPWMLRDLWVASVTDGGPAHRVCGGEGVGCLAGPWSPSGERTIVWRLTRDRMEAGVLEVATHEIRWLALHPDIPVFGETVLWVDEEHLVAVDRLDGPLPYHFGWERIARAETARDWTLAQEGRAPTALVWGVPPFDEGVQAPPQARVVELDLSDPTAEGRTLWQGRFWDMSLSHDGATLAVMEAGPRFPNIEGRSPSPSGRAWRRTLTLIDRKAGKSRRPLAEQPVGASLMTWSDHGRLLVHTLDNRGHLGAGALVAVGFDDTTIEWSLDGLSTDTARHPLADPTLVRAAWRGEAPVVAARKAGEERVDWYRLDADGPTALTGAFEVPPTGIAGSWREGLLMLGDGAAWLVGDDGSRRRIPGTAGVRPTDFLGLWDAPRLRWNPRPPTGARTLAADEDRLLRISPDVAGARVEAWTASGVLMDVSGTQHLTTARQGGSLTLRLGGASAPDRTLMVLNSQMKDIAFIEPLPIRHVGPDGEALISWLWPAGGTGGPAPLVVAAYPGSSTRDTPEATPHDDPAARSAIENPQLLAAAGYAVLQPSLPGARFPLGGDLTPQLLAIVDAVAAQHADTVDVERLAYLGHSFGGWGGLEVATRTDRFDAIIVSSAPSNFTQMWGEFPPWIRGAPRYGDGYQFQQGWTEIGQGGVGAPPWDDPDGFIRASPFFRADQIQAPVLMIHGDREPALAQAEAMFSAFWRLNHPARLVVYRGEGHLLASPANLSDAHRQILDFLGDVLESPHPALSPPSAAPSSPPSRP